MNDSDDLIIGKDFWINLSVSPCSSATALGFDDSQINRLTLRIAHYWLGKLYKLMLGHDWREGGIMRTVGTLTETTTPLRFRKDQFPRLLNLVPHPSTTQLNKSGQHAAEASEGLLQVWRLYDLLWPSPGLDSKRGAALDSSPLSLQSTVQAHMAPSKRLQSIWGKDMLSRLWVLRHVMTEMLQPGARICLGGTTSGYGGWIPGIAEEAYFAYRSDKPLYLIGGFGGATAEVIAAMCPEMRSTLYGVEETRKKSIDLFYQHADRAARAPTAMKKRFGVGERNVFEYFASQGIEKLSSANGLSVSENQQLFRCTDIEQALRLIHVGVRNVVGSTTR
ncbi:MAG: hypothetical protein AB8G17_07400 [Gammaproteobacteria bacterium]